MKKLVSILFSLVILFPLVSKSLVIVWFKANQHEIANTLCVNKNNTKRKDCQGCCVLNENLNKIDQTETSTSKLPSKEQKQQEDFQWISSSKNTCSEISNTNGISIPQAVLIQFLSDQYLVDITKPPCLS
ncbi:MAG: hypothetical protein CFE21_08550 [Bacteroidetes bacterium B1(2017)]|nr:MAG: hypothetical protein CFE21_08550 [Bacteroidetes bacterium B1(2017)]